MKKEWKSPELKILDVSETFHRPPACDKAQGGGIKNNPHCQPGHVDHS